jgi:hypothetical protein
MVALKKAPLLGYSEEQIMTCDWMIDADSIEVVEAPSTLNGVTTLDSRIEELYRRAKLPFDISVMIDYAKHLNVPEISERVPWVYKLLELDMSLGPGGYTLRFRPKTYAFFHLLNYDSIYRPMKYVYMPFGLTTSPASFSRDIAQNACAHVEKCVQELLRVRGLMIHRKATLGKMISKYSGEFDSDTFSLISSLNDLVYGKTKHQFDVDLPRLQLVTLGESLAIYFVCRTIGLKLLQEAGILADVISEINRGRSHKGVFIGQEWFRQSSPM